MSHSPLSRLIMTEATNGYNATYFQALAFNKELGATRGIDAALEEYNLDAIVLPAPGLAPAPAGLFVLFNTYLQYS